MVCRVCGRPADQFRDHVVVVNMRIEVTCRACVAGATTTPGPQETGSDPAPAVSGTVARPPLARPEAPKRSEAIGLLAVLVVAAASVAIALGLRARRAASTPSPPKSSVVSKDRKTSALTGKPPLRTSVMAGEDELDVELPPPEGLAAVLEGKWTHPLPGPFRDLPTHEGRRFGAYRARDEYRNRYCGHGHCGVDLGYEVGLPILAVRDGELERVVRSPTEVEGKYLKIRHPGGLRSYYMHLDEIAPDLVEGGTVKAGQMIGTLGRTGIKFAEPHLHFMISFESKGKEIFVDPEPLLVEAELVEVDRIPDWAKR